MDQLHKDLATQHTIWKAQELAQHTDNEAWEDCHDATQTFKGCFGMAKLEEILCLLDLTSQDNLPKALSFLGLKQEKVR